MVTVLTGGKFNKLHPGHLYLLKHAKKLGKVVVVLANDRNNDRSYAKPAKIRKKMLEKAGLADKVVVGNADDYFAVVEKYEPDIILLGYDQQLPMQIKEKLKTLKKKIKIIRAKKHGNYRTRD